METKEDKIFHNTQLLLAHYRDAVWSLEIAVNRVNQNIFLEYGSDIEGFLDMTYEAGLDLKGTEIEAQTKTIARTRNMLQMVDHAVDLMRKKHKRGESYYWILYYSYLSPQEANDVEEIVNKLSVCFKDISKRTYYRKREEAVRQLSWLLWGYTSQDCLKILNLLCPENEEKAVWKIEK